MRKEKEEVKTEVASCLLQNRLHRFFLPPVQQDNNPLPEESRGWMLIRLN
jgi:hypothetical protein